MDKVLTCKLCQKSFSGNIPYAQHLKSEKHLKKEKEGEIEILIRLPVTKDGNLSCSICDKMFSGIIPLNQHLQSAGHYRNVNRSKLTDKVYCDLKLNVKHANINSDQLQQLCKSGGENNQSDIACEGVNIQEITLSKPKSVSSECSTSLESSACASTSQFSNEEENQLRGCSVCGISSFENYEAHIYHLNTDSHLRKKLMDMKITAQSTNI